jgi:hypothetical protein
MPIFGRKNKKKTNRTSYSEKRNGFDAGEGTGLHNPNNGSKIIGVPGGENQVRPPQKKVKVDSKKVTEIEKPKSEAPVLKESTQKTKETAAEFRARKANELKAKKDELVKKQKKVTADKAAKGAGDGPEKTEIYKGVTSDDKEGQAKIASSNERIKKNREAKAAAIKAGKSTYKMVNKAGQTVTGRV